MPFMIGGFANGLFSGASDALKIGMMYQGYTNQQAQIDAAEQAKTAAENQQWNEDSDSNLDATVKYAEDSGILDKPKSDSQTSKPSTTTELTRPEAPDFSKLKKPAAITTPAPSGPAVTPDAPIPTATKPPSGPATSAMLYKDYDQAEGALGRQQYDLATGYPLTVSQQIARSANYIKSGYQPRPGAQPPPAQPAGSPPPLPTSENEVIPGYVPRPGARPPLPAPAPAQPTIAGGSGTGAAALENQPISGYYPRPGAQPPTGPALPPPPVMSQIYARPGVYTPRPGAQPPPPAPAPSQPSVAGGSGTGAAALENQPIPGYVPRPGAQPPPPGPAPSMQAPPVITQQPQNIQPGQGPGALSRYPSQPQPQPQPGFPGPASQAEPTGAPGLGQKLLGMLNPIGSAQAAETPPAPTGAPPGAQAGAQPAASVTPPPASPAADKQPSLTERTAQPQKGPTTTDKPVVANQQGPTTESETPQPPAPAFDHRPYQWLQQKWPEAYKLVNQIAEQEGANPAQLALHWYLESRFQTTSPSSDKGAVGPLQVIPSTRDLVDPKHQLDPNSLEGSLTLAARYIHHELDPKFGVGTPSAIIAYHSGPGNVDLFTRTPLDQLAATHPQGVKYLQDAYPGLKLTPANFTSNTSVNPPELVNAGNTHGPDGFLDALVRTGPAGMTMTNLWRQAENSLVYAALRRGDWNGVAAARDYVFQMSHQGAMSNLMAADQNILAGNMSGAAQSLAKAHAFFPDGSYAGFGVAKDGSLWGQQFNENTREPMGKPFEITHDAIAMQLAQSQDPHKYLAFVQEQQKLNSQIALNAAHQKYYETLPDWKTQIAAQHDAARIKAEEDTNLVRLQIAGAKQDNDAKWQATVDKEAAGLYTPGGEKALDLGKGATPEDYATHAEIFTALRNSPQPDGGHLSTANAANLAGGIANGSLKVGPMQQARDGSAYHAVVDAKTGQPRGYLSADQGDRLRGLAGATPIMPPKAPATAPGPGGAVGGGGVRPGPQMTGAPAPGGAIGAGAGSQMAMYQGLNQNLTGQPLQALPA